MCFARNCTDRERKCKKRKNCTVRFYIVDITVANMNLGEDFILVEILWIIY